MTIDLGASVAPQSLTMREILEVTADAMIVLGLTHRAITHAGIWDRKDAVYGRAEDIPEHAFTLAREDLDMWLDDMKSDGTPRFFNNDMLGKALRTISDHYVKLFNATEDKDLPALIDALAARNFARLIEL